MRRKIGTFSKGCARIMRGLQRNEEGGPKTLQRLVIGRCAAMSFSVFFGLRVKTIVDCFVFATNENREQKTDQQSKNDFGRGPPQTNQN